MNKKIIFTLPLLLVAMFVMTSNAEAKSNWEQYFSVDEAKSIKNMVKKSIMSEFENPEGDWKKIISSKMLKNGSIDADKVGDDIAKKKIYTGNYPSSIGDDDIPSCREDDADECTHYIKIAAPEIKLSNTPIVLLYEKNSTRAGLTDTWVSQEVYFKDGYAYTSYASSDDGLIEDTRFGNEYKLVISY